MVSPPIGVISAHEDPAHCDIGSSFRHLLQVNFSISLTPLRGIVSGFKNVRLARIEFALNPFDDVIA